LDQWSSPDLKKTMPKSMKLFWGHVVAQHLIKTLCMQSEQSKQMMKCAFMLLLVKKKE